MTVRFICPCCSDVFEEDEEPDYRIYCSCCCQVCNGLEGDCYCRECVNVIPPEPYPTMPKVSQ